MASERQISANRINAQRSKGPKSEAGKKKSSKNALRHGLSRPVSKVGSEAQFQEEVRQFAGDTSDPEVRTFAERAAEAQLDLTRVRRAKAALIERAAMLSGAGRPHLAISWHGAAEIGWDVETLEINDPGGHPFLLGGREEEQQFFAAIRPILAELIKLNRYEKRAMCRRDRAISKIVSIKTGRKPRL
jgi:hypothetical protein